MKTTLKQIRAHRPCVDGWEKLLAHLGKTKADNEPLAILTILESNGLDDALWALRAVEGKDCEIRLMACDFAESVLGLFEEGHPDDKRPREAIETARKFAKGKATKDELRAAWAAAGAAADAAWVARDAVWAEVWAAWAAAGAAADPAWVARDAVWAAVRAKQEGILRKYCEGSK